MQFVLKTLFYIWFIRRLAQTERPEIRRQRAVPQKLQEAEKWAILKASKYLLCRQEQLRGRVRLKPDGTRSRTGGEVKG